MDFNIKNLIDNNKMTGLQYATLAVCFLMNMLDGMDVMVISYTAPSIAKEWAVSSEALGVVFSMGLLGMAIGAMFLAPRADIIGRRSMILSGNRIEIANPTARLILDPDYETIVWNKEERMKGQAWGLQTVPSFHTRGTPMPEDL